MPELTITPESGSWGSAIHVEGSGFPPQKQIRVSLCTFYDTATGEYIEAPYNGCWIGIPGVTQNAFKDDYTWTDSTGSFVVPSYVVEAPFRYPPASFRGRILVNAFDETDPSIVACRHFTVTEEVPKGGVRFLVVDDVTSQAVRQAYCYDAVGGGYTDVNGYTEYFRRDVGVDIYWTIEKSGYETVTNYLVRPQPYDLTFSVHLIPVAPTVPTAHFTTYVYDGQTYAPLGNALVEAKLTGEPWEQAVTAQTDAQGTVVLLLFENEFYDIRASKTGYEPALLPDAYVIDGGFTTFYLTPIPEALTVTFIADKTAGVAPLTVIFTVGIYGGIAPYEYSLDFGDGSTPEAGNKGSLGDFDVSHVYAEKGTYLAVVTVTDALNTLESNQIRVGIETVSPSALIPLAGALVVGSVLALFAVTR